MDTIYLFFNNLFIQIDDWLNFKEKLNFYREKMKEATTFKSWKKYALILDKLEQKNEWKKKDYSSLYDYREVSFSTHQLISKKEKGEFIGLMHLLRNLLTKNIFSINTPYLYSYCNYGTKENIEKFISEIHSSLEFLIKLPENKLPLMKKLEFFSEAKHSYGRTALMLSGGAIFGLYHIGIIVTLLENNLLPQVICGSSVGSIIAATLCCLNYDELHSFLTRKHEVYDGPFHLKNYNDGVFTKLQRLFFKGAVRDIEVLKSYLRDVIGDITFKEAYIKTGRILNVNVTGYKEHDHNILLNYITSPDVLVFSACTASSAAPVMFSPSELLCKNEYGQIVPYSITSKRKKFIDGSLSADVPMKRLGELFNVNTFLVSQVNPWVIPFLDEDDENKNLFKRKKLSIWTILKGLILSELRHRIKQIQKILPYNSSRLLNLLSQDYTGDITVFPEFCLRDILQLIRNPTGLDYHRYKIYGNRRIFQKISIIESIVRTELLLEKYYLKLKNKLQKQVIQNKKYTMDDNNLEPKVDNKSIYKFLNNDPLLNIKGIDLTLNKDLENLKKISINTKVRNKEEFEELTISNDFSSFEFQNSTRMNKLHNNIEKLDNLTKNIVINTNYDFDYINKTNGKVEDIDNYFLSFEEFDCLSLNNFENSFCKNKMLKHFNNEELNMKLLEEIDN